MLGSPVGSDTFGSSPIVAKARAGEKDIAEMGNGDRDLPCKARYALRHLCHLPKLDHLLRTVSPENTFEGCRIIDKAVQKAMASLINYPELAKPESPEARAAVSQMSLPIRVGESRQRHAAYLVS